MNTTTQPATRGRFSAVRFMLGFVLVSIGALVVAGWWQLLYNVGNQL